MKTDPDAGAALDLAGRIRACRVCEKALGFEPRPVCAFGSASKIVIVGQAPGRKVHDSGVPWNDPSGRLLREWLGVGEVAFYDTAKFALMPMGFCYPGGGKRGDLPPRPECAPLWHERILGMMTGHRLILLVGLYAQRYYLGERSHTTLTENVRDFRGFLPRYFPLPHPSPRNRAWLARNSWFAKEVLPELRARVRAWVL